jgi:hypothetical protein
MSEMAKQSDKPATRGAPEPRLQSAAVAATPATVNPMGLAAFLHTTSSHGGAPVLPPPASAQQHRAILAMQRTIGNAEVQRFLSDTRPASAPLADPAPAASGSASGPPVRVRRQEAEAEAGSPKFKTVRHKLPPH